MKYANRPISRLKRLLGFSSAEEVAEAFELKKSTADNLNTGRAARNLTTAYQIICSLMDYVPWEIRHKFISRSEIDLPLAEKNARILFLQKQIESLPDEIQKHMEKAQDILTNFLNYKAELSRLQNYDS